MTANVLQFQNKMNEPEALVSMFDTKISLEKYPGLKLIDFSDEFQKFTYRDMLVEVRSDAVTIQTYAPEDESIFDDVSVYEIEDFDVAIQDINDEFESRIDSRIDSGMVAKCQNQFYTNSALESFLTDHPGVVVLSGHPDILETKHDGEYVYSMIEYKGYRIVDNMDKVVLAAKVLSTGYNEVARFDTYKGAIDWINGVS